MKVSLYVPCIINHLMPDSAYSIINIFKKCGVDFSVEEKQLCCGQPGYNMGFCEHSKPFARKFIDLYKNLECDYIVVPSGSCAAMIKHNYPGLFPAENLKWLEERVVEFNRFMYDNELYLKLDLKYKGAIFYHKSCHLLNEMQIDREPKEMLRSIKGLRLFESETHQNTCCGFGGAFSAAFDNLSIDIGISKLQFVIENRISNIVAGDAGCIMHLKGVAAARGYKLNFHYIADFLDLCSN